MPFVIENNEVVILSFLAWILDTMIIYRLWTNHHEFERL